MEMVILERVREDIYEHKKLNVHLFNCLKKALYKPAGFFKGFLFPLAASGKPTPSTSLASLVTTDVNTSS
jgi:essential nuclear protein 1